MSPIRFKPLYRNNLRDNRNSDTNCETINNKLWTDLKRDVDFTARNYAHMYTRLQNNDVASRFFVTYYSVISILYGLIPLFFQAKLVPKTLLNFLALSSSIVVLIASLTVSLAKYGERSHQVMQGLDQMKRFKKQLSLYKENGLTSSEYEMLIKQYHQIVDRVELRIDLDYYLTCYDMYKNKKYVENWNSFSWFQKIKVYFFPGVKNLFYIVLIILPLCIFPLKTIIF